MGYENIFWQNYLFHSSKETFLQLLKHFLKIKFWRKINMRGPYKKSENFVLSKKGVRKYFWQNYLFNSSKETFLQHLRQFLENWIFDGKSTGPDLTKKWKFGTISKWGKKIFFWKINCSTHQKKHFYNIWGSFWKIEFLTENRQARTLQNSEIFVLSQNGVRKYFLANLFVPLIKRNLSTIFEAVFGKLNFWRKIDRRKPYKIVKILYYLKMG